jgi:hypothetical protein
VLLRAPFRALVPPIAASELTLLLLGVPAMRPVHAAVNRLLPAGAPRTPGGR